MPAIYLPVMAKFERHTYGWWNTRSPFKYRYAFASYPNLRECRRLREEFGFDSDVILYSDSGGYSLLTRDMSIDPYDLARWYNESDVDFAMALDYPPYADPRKNAVIEFDRRLEFTVQSSKILVDNVKSSVRLYAPLHGVNFKQYEVWRQAMLLVTDDWFGWALGVAPVDDPNAVLRLIRYLESIKNDKPVHFFESGDAVCFLLVARYASKRGLLVTVDSMYASSAARRGRKYVTPLGRMVNVGPEQENALASLDCLCPVCQRYGPDSVRHDYELLDLHNTYLVVWRARLLNAISAEKPEAIKQLLPDAVPYVRQLDAILEGRSGLLGFA
jgi:tRNA-guanine family transglycosylase